MNPVQININPNLPGMNPSSTGIGGFIANFYSFALIIAGILAFGAIVYGGIKYAVGKGNPSSESEGKSWITGALVGLLLLASAYVVLYTVNPQLVSLGLPSLPSIPITPAPVPTSTAGTAGTCTLTPLAAITDPQAQAMENGQKVIWNSSDPNVQKNLNALSAAFTKLKAALAMPGVGDSVTVNSAYRPLAYQAHLYDIYQRELQLRNNSDALGNPDCTPLVSALRLEEAKHGICFGSGACLVAAPNACSNPHVLGIGIDLTLSGPVNLSAINPILQANNVGIIWRALPGDPVHFQLQNPPYTGCAAS